LPKKISDTQREEIIKGFLSGKGLLELSEEFGFTKLTISRNLKKKLGDEKFTHLLNKQKKVESFQNKKIDQHFQKSKEALKDKQFEENLIHENTNTSFDDNNFFQTESFMELVPVDLDIDNNNRKEFSSIPIEEIDFPRVVFMIVDKKIELETKLLKDYPEWHFLPEEDLKYKTIEIFSDLKDAKRSCNKEQKVIKVPNPNVFKVASKIMLSRGISRIISDKQLIAL